MTRTEILGKYPNLSDANLSDADLRGADLRNADLYSADLRNANLRNANLRNADLRNADLSNADLRNANLCNANLSNADLRGANLCSANLSGADLCNANLRGAYLSYADLCNAKGLLTLATPPEKGAFIAYKKLSNGTVAELRIPAQAKRTGSYVGRKCRAKFVDVRTGQGPSHHNPRVTYAPGKRVKSDSYNPDPRVECTHGIHFFMTRQEAEDYEL